MPYLQHSQLVFLSSQVDGGFVVLVNSGVVRPLLQQQLHSGHVAVGRRQQQWGVVVLVTPIDTCTSATGQYTGVCVSVCELFVFFVFLLLLQYTGDGEMCFIYCCLHALCILVHSKASIR